MNVVFYKSNKGNFGDDLNPWLWPQIFNGRYPDDLFFLGIGSVLSNDVDLVKVLPTEKVKVIFDAGVRQTYSPIKLNEGWDVFFLRGPLSSKAYNYQYPWISDSGYCIRLLDIFPSLVNEPKMYDVSLMPHVTSARIFNWRKLCDKWGVHYISPHSERGVEFTLREISRSKKIITEAMHGAIIADALRVPWHRFILSTPYYEGGAISEFKWEDWLLSINVNCQTSTYIKLKRKSKLNELVLKLSSNFIDIQFIVKSLVKAEIENKLIGATDFYLSSDETIHRLDEELFEKVNLFKKKYSE